MRTGDTTMEPTGIVRAEQPTTLDERTAARVVESLVLRGDVSALGPAERARYYVNTCDSLGLNPMMQPLAFLKLNGKEILYPTKGATDQLAAIHRLTRETIDGPKVVDVAGLKLIHALCRVTHPNGRVETATGMVPLPTNGAEAVCNAFLKVETKAKRRATLSILGLGMLDESEVETIPVSAKEPGGGVDMDLVRLEHEQPKTLPAPPPPPPSKVPTDLEVFRSRFAALACREDAAQLWVDWRDRLRAIEGADITGWGDLADQFAKRGWKAEPHARGWLKRASQEIVDRASQQPDNDPPNGTNGGARRTPGATSTDASGSAQESHGGGGASVSMLPGVPEWAKTGDGIRAHLSTKRSRSEIENSVRVHGKALGTAYQTPAAERLVAVSTPSDDGTRLGMIGATILVEGWAYQGPRVRRAVGR